MIDRELAANGSNLAVKATVLVEQLKQMLGVDLAAMAPKALATATIPPAPPRPRPPTSPGTGGASKPPGSTG